MIARLALALALASSPEQDRAAELAEEARLAFEAQRYDDAVRLIDEAFALDPQRHYLYALAQAERMAGLCEDAIEHYRAFLAADPSDNAGQNARENIAECEDKLKQAEANPEPEPPPPVVVTPPPTPPPTVDRRPWHRDPAAGVLLGIGSAVLVGGVTMYAVAAARIQSPERAANFGDYEQRVDAARPVGFAGIGLASAGAILVIGAIVRYAVVRKRDAVTPPRTAAW